MRTGFTIMTLRQSHKPPNGKSKQTDKGETGEEQSQEHDHFLQHHKEFVLKANQSIQHTTVTFYVNCMKMCEDFALNFVDKKLSIASGQFTVSYFLFHQGIFDKRQHDCCPLPPYFSLFPRLKIKLKIEFS
jgi:hypothetical protein